jgi:hypothetical protein
VPERESAKLKKGDGFSTASERGLFKNAERMLPLPLQIKHAEKPSG